jgi:Cys-rich protein (TIGR01571 family)
MAETDINLTEALIATPGTNETNLVTVTAPANLDEGYTFDAVHNGTTFTVTVPPGGVNKGQILRVPLTTSSSSPGVTDSTFVVPEGQWRDEFCDCCKHGSCEALCCLSFWCYGIALGQVMQRMKLTFYGMVTTTGSNTYKSTCKIMLVLWLICRAFNLSVSIFRASGVNEGVKNVDPKDIEPGATSYIQVVLMSITGVFAIYFLIMGTLNRNYMRRRFNIEGNICFDCLAHWCCACCAVIQETRHTHDFEAYPPMLISSTGLGPDAPEIEV